MSASVLVHAAGVAVLVAVTLGLHFALVAPAHRERAARTARVQQAAQDAQDLKVLEDHTHALERLSHSLESKLVDTVELRPVDHLNKQVAAVSELVEEQNLHVTRVDPGEAQVTPRYTLVPIRVAGQGTFADVVNFLHELHDVAKDTEVRAFAVRADPKASSDLVTFELCLGWYAVQGPSTRAMARPAGGAVRTDSTVADVPESR